MTGQGDHLTVFIQPIIKESIDRFVLEKDVTLFMVLVCAYAALLTRYCGQEM
jgi:non-ribosomal peptide synthetase component F